ncbi:E3 ubiquitin-protein ligase EL5-like [Brachypodium distachyon]|uniref:RING-type E3 ubiquitin transferase n=1 Tax=Brachypodium distachyon TaxID=15368 RepID=A0A2K2DSL9_BRADI|nr:E3 ubiquitin-protein ligase EL5-like [Brachypodium distachyon]PNT77275.1 hypothetical protein BRADI_1g60395v3 [Brachypodium distachyon]|eukprot:XP_003561566.1 E3 ubiquitin-protein ligase EL5-like [Brachypodium distachyon]
MIAIAGAVVAGAAAAAAVLVLRSSRDDDDDVRPEGAVAAVWPSQECAVCLSELVAGTTGGSCDSEVRMLAGCGHGFHEECIGRWLPLRPECPLCRCPVPVPEAEGESTEAAVVAVAPQAAAWSRPARIACGFGDGRVVWTRSPPTVFD